MKIVPVGLATNFWLLKFTVLLIEVDSELDGGSGDFNFSDSFFIFCWKGWGQKISFQYNATLIKI